MMESQPRVDWGKQLPSCPSCCVGGLSLTPCTSRQLSTAVFVPFLMLSVVSAPLHFSSVKQGGSEPRREGPCFMVSSSCHGVGVVPLQLCPTSSVRSLAAPRDVMYPLWLLSCPLLVSLCPPGSVDDTHKSRSMEISPLVLWTRLSTAMGGGGPRPRTIVCPGTIQRRVATHDTH